MWNASKVSTAREDMQRLRKRTETKKRKGKEKQMTKEGGAVEWNLDHGARKLVDLLPTHGGFCSVYCSFHITIVSS